MVPPIVENADVSDFLFSGALNLTIVAAPTRSPQLLEHYQINETSHSYYYIVSYQVPQDVLTEQGLVPDHVFASVMKLVGFYSQANNTGVARLIRPVMRLGPIDELKQVNQERLADHHVLGRNS